MESTRILSVTALTLLLSSCSLMPGAWEESEIDHSVFQGIADPLDLPRSLSSVGWDWEAPEETDIVDVRPFPLGVVVTVSDGVIALQGDTGEELWRYRRVGEAVTDANVTASGDRVALAYPVGEDSEAAAVPHDVVLLDSDTGEELGAHVEDFTAEEQVPGNITTLSPKPEHLGLLSDSSRIVYRKLDDQRTGVFSLDLETGDESWSLTNLREEGQQGRDFHPKGVVASGDTIILSGNFMDEDIESPDETAEEQTHTVVLLGLDANSGEELWRHEIERGAPINSHPVELGVQRPSGAVVAVASGPQGVQEWILDPASGEQLAEEKFFSGREGNVIGALENAVVTEQWLVEDDEFEYSYTDFSGNTHTTLHTPGQGARLGGVFVLPLEKAIVWLDVNQTNTSFDPDEAAWDEARLVVDEDGESRVIDLGIRVERDYSQDGSELQRSSLPGPPDMTVAPGALVVQEKVTGSPRRLVGVVP
ncbi:PQQ-binding-like beta-propeller repeat protein [Nocardiopsis sp. B62]|uniref:outer membrane protein assembly factor BamB family protein n=1 Tax=Nocardiopsis sp. B62 TaxID=2824874 RepID=UPI001B376C81|nr:PQQ-binding-like beta-propeller repeat protein [Nocardiopsis sp. B62]MBQ1083463.1 PQQ-like beta-propeller repeat protein [Nocardiopsis sp. B62]